MWEGLPEALGRPLRCRAVETPRTPAPVGERRLHSSPALFVSNQPGIARIGAAKVQLMHAFLMCFLDTKPQKIRHGTELTVTEIETAVFIGQDSVMSKSQNTGDGNAVFVGDANVGTVTEATEKAAKPVEWLRRREMPLPRERKQLEKVLQQRFRRPF